MHRKKKKMAQRQVYRGRKGIVPNSTASTKGIEACRVTSAFYLLAPQLSSKESHSIQVLFNHSFSPSDIWEHHRQQIAYDKRCQKEEMREKLRKLTLNMKHILSLLGNKFLFFILKLRMYYGYILSTYDERVKNMKVNTS